MFVWLVENAGLFYWLLGLTALGLFAAWWSTRHRKVLWAFGAVVGVIAAITLLSMFVDTDEKKITRIVAEMAQGVREKNVDKIFQHISMAFNYYGKDHEQFREYAKMHLRHGRADDLSLSRATLLSRQNGQAKAEFWVHSAEAQGIRCEADFVLENGQWKMKGFDLFLSTSGNKFILP